MELTIDNIRRITKEALLSFDSVQDAYIDLLYKIENNAKKGLTDYLFYINEFKGQEYIYWSVVKLAKLNGFEITRFDDVKEFVNIGW